MARLAISKDYFPAYAALSRKAQRKADEFLSKFQRDSTAAALHVEPIHGALDKQLRSARIGDDYRIVLRAPETGDVYLVLWIDHHDEAYRWAVTKQTAVHPATGSLQIFDAQNAARALTTPPPSNDVAPAPQPPQGLLAKFSDADLFAAGVPRPLIPSVRSVFSEEDLDLLLPHLPSEAGEVLTGLAAGISLDQALEEVLGRAAAPAGAPTPPPVDVQDVVAALEREPTQRQFRLFDGSLDLDAALKHPLDVWRVFLHPRQRRLAHARTKGPTRVLGGAGTGKTVVALHRAAFLVREVFTKPDDRVLFTTFTVNLAQDLRTQLAKLLEPDQLARVEVTNVDKWASDHLRRRGVPVRLALEQEQRTMFRSAYEVYGDEQFAEDFCRAEWREVVQDQGIDSEQAYVLAVRRHRGVPLSRADRRRIWPVLASYRDTLEQGGYLEPIDVLRRALRELSAEGGPPRYQAVVVDEVQDFSADALKLVRAIAGPERPDDLFLVGDAHQRIYGRPVALSSCGIQVRGRRSQTLRLNYRTTGAICRWSLGALSDVEVDDLDEGKADRRGYVSLREGVAPVVRVLSTQQEEEREVVSAVQRAIEAGVTPEGICVVARTRAPLIDRFEPALTRAGIDAVLLDKEEPRRPAVRLATMHRVKGLEFAVVILANATRDALPFPSEELRSEDSVVSAQAMLRERCLLYVAASRARDELFVTAVGALTSLIAQRPAPAPKPVTVPPAPRASLTSALASIELPTRMADWAERQGLTTVEQLACRSPAQLLEERNLGRTTIADTRALLEPILGCRWEDYSGASPTAPAPAMSLDEAVRTGVWDEVRLRLTEELRATPLASMELPARLRSYADREGLKVLSDLAERSAAQLMSAPNLSRTSVRDLVRVVGEYGARMARERELARLGLLEGFKALVQEQEPMLRIIMTRRAGLAGEAETLQALGETFGITRERIRQLEARTNQSFGRHEWAHEAERRVREAVAAGPVSVRSLAGQAWWAAATDLPEVLRYVVENVLAVDAWLVDWDDEWWLSPQNSASVTSAWRELEREIEALPLPTPTATIHELGARATAKWGIELGRRFQQRLLQLAQADDTGVVRAIGDTRRAEILSILSAADEPVSVEQLQAQLGVRFRIPDEAIRFGGGRIGLEKHLPNFTEWRSKLVPAAVKLVKTLGPDRQWSCTELLDELREEHQIPDWLSPWCLVALIRRGSELTYLGRLRVGLPDAGEERIFAHELAEKILREAGGPMPRDLLVSKMSARIGVSEFTYNQLFQRPQFVAIDDDTVGLLDRDVPGGAAAIAEALDQLESALERRGRGLSAFHANDEIRQLSADHAQWTPALTKSLARGDGRFRTSIHGAIGLASWESTRVPTRLELVRSALVEAGGRVSIEAVAARIEAHFGESPPRTSLAGIAAQIGAGLDGEWMVARERGEGSAA